MKKGIFLTAFCSIVLNIGSFSQSSKTTEDEEYYYNSAFCYGVTTNTNSGILGGVAIKSLKKIPSEIFGHVQYRYIGIELVNVRHPKEVPFTNLSNGSFVYGKTNYLLPLRLQYGREIVLSSRNAEEGIAISTIVALGPTIGIVKPYIIQYETKPGSVSAVPFDPKKHTNPSSILGTGNFLDGFNKATFTFGVNAKISFDFELSAFRNSTTGLEVGFLAEAYANKIPILSTHNTTIDPNKQIYSSAFVILYFGNRK